MGSRRRWGAGGTYQSALLGFWQEQEDHDESNDVQAGVEGKCTRGSHGRKHTRERNRQNGRPEQTCRHGPGHADLAMRQWKHLGRVCERHGAFTRRVKSRKLAGLAEVSPVEIFGSILTR